jgi:hypothetical protein
MMRAIGEAGADSLEAARASSAIISKWGIAITAVVRRIFILNFAHAGLTRRAKV